MSGRRDLLEIEEADDAITVRFRETVSLREDNIPRIAAVLFRVADRLGPRTLSLDLGWVALVTSHALGEFVSLHKKVREGGGRLRVCNVAPPGYEVFEITRLHTVMDIRLATPPPRESLRVLIVDDSVDAADSLRVLLDLWGHATCVAHDGTTALGAVDAFGPHVVLLDIQMPGMSGGEVAVRLRRRPGQPRILLVAMTANASDDPRLAPYNGLFNYYLRKPYNLERLEHLLADCAAQLVRAGPEPRTAMEP
jgi:anti-anti-sigma factor